MILSNCLPNPSPSQPGKSLAIAQIQAFVIADQKRFGNMTVLLRFGSFPFTHHMLLSSDHSLALIFQQEKPDHLAWEPTSDGEEGEKQTEPVPVLISADWLNRVKPDFSCPYPLLLRRDIYRKAWVK